MSETSEYFKANTISRDFFHLIVGEKIGYGVARETYECNTDKNLVIKFETGGQSFQNIIEHKFWEDNSHCEEVNRWLAPVVSISTCGSVLLMKRTEPIPRSFKLPLKMPSFLGDFKRTNFGLLDGKLVCHDYGTSQFGTDTKLRKANWRGEI